MEVVTRGGYGPAIHNSCIVHPQTSSTHLRGVINDGSQMYLESTTLSHAGLHVLSSHSQSLQEGQRDKAFYDVATHICIVFFVTKNTDTLSRKAPTDLLVGSPTVVPPSVEPEWRHRQMHRMKQEAPGRWA